MMRDRGTWIAASVDVTITDAVIIYLACGAPLGMYRAHSQGRTVGGILMVVLMWPVAAARLAASAVRQAASDPRDRLLSIRGEIESRALAGSSPEEMFEFREVFERYSGLAQALAESSSPAVAGIFDLTDHPSKPLALSCLLRSQHAKLRRHAAAARAEIAAILSDRRSREMDELVSQLADLLGDPALGSATSEPVESRHRHPSPQALAN